MLVVKVDRSEKTVIITNDEYEVKTNNLLQHCYRELKNELRIYIKIKITN